MIATLEANPTAVVDIVQHVGTDGTETPEATICVALGLEVSAGPVVREIETNAFDTLITGTATHALG
jgi:hypothetical protein